MYEHLEALKAIAAKRCGGIPCATASSVARLAGWHLWQSLEETRLASHRQPLPRPNSASLRTSGSSRSSSIKGSPPNNKSQNCSFRLGGRAAPHLSGDPAVLVLGLLWRHTRSQSIINWLKHTPDVCRSFPSHSATPSQTCYEGRPNVYCVPVPSYSAVGIGTKKSPRATGEPRVFSEPRPPAAPSQPQPPGALRRDWCWRSVLPTSAASGLSKGGAPPGRSSSPPKLFL